MGKRGQVTQEVNEISQRFLGKDLTKDELRLIPYIHYTLVNSRRIDRVRINAEERIILGHWHADGHIQGGVQSDLKVTKDFWDFMCEVLWIAYATSELH